MNCKNEKTKEHFSLKKMKMLKYFHRYVKNNKFENVKEKIWNNTKYEWKMRKNEIYEIREKTYCKSKLSFDKTVKKISKNINESKILKIPFFYLI